VSGVTGSDSANNSARTRVVVVLPLILGVAALAMAPSLIWGLGGLASADYAFVWTKQFGEAFALGHLYPRWLPQSFEGLGSPAFYFYPPLAFMLSGAFAWGGLTTSGAIIATGALLLLASGAAMYAWLRFRNGPAVLGAIFYMAAPYHLADWYVRCALAEFAAFVWIPLIALAIEAQPRRWAGPLLAIAYAGLILSHLPVALLVSIALIAPLVAWRAFVTRSICGALRCAIFLGLGAGLAAGYLAPALTLQGHIANGVFWAPYYQPETWFPYNAVPTGARSLSYAMVSIALAAMALAGGSAFMVRRRAEPWFWTALTVAAALASMGLLPGFWSLPLVAKVQFPWRLLSVIEFAAITAFALAAAPRIPLTLAAALALPGLVLFAAPAVAYLARDDRAFAERLDRTMADASEYLPPGVRGADVAGVHGPLVEGAASRWTADSEGTVTIQAATPGRIVVRRFVFPAWRLTHNGATIPIEPHGPIRLISFVAQEPGVYRLQRRTLPQEKAGWWISFASLLALGCYAGLAPSRRGEEWRARNASNCDPMETRAVRRCSEFPR
jgi:hypothetical protein